MECFGRLWDRFSSIVGVLEAVGLELDATSNMLRWTASYTRFDQ
jgi:hypothetical protein